MSVVAVFLPKDPETTLFDCTLSVEQAIRGGCRLHVRRTDSRMALLPKMPDRNHWHDRGWDLFGAPIPVKAA